MQTGALQPDQSSSGSFPDYMDIDNFLHPQLQTLSLSGRSQAPSRDGSLNNGNIPPFLALPGEIRNQIYRLILLSFTPFTIKLQFAPLFTALMRVNRQIYHESAGIFYSENTFRFPQGLFIGADLLGGQLQNLYHLQLPTLRMMTSIVLAIPVRYFCFRENRDFWKGQEHCLRFWPGL